MHCIEVHRTDTGTLDIPGAATVEDWSEVYRLIGESVEDLGPLTGWGRWTHLTRMVDTDGRARWYFLDANS